MAIIKSYTDISQSKTLSKILKTESADMYYSHEFVNSAGDYYKLNIVSEGYFDDKELLGSDIPAWSLAALLNIIPQEIFNGEYVINITNGLDNKWIITYDTGNSSSFYGLVSSSDNIVDSCVDIIEKLHKLKML